MSSHIDRMKEEHKSLAEKVIALNAFIHSNPIFYELDDIERADMVKQLGFMEAYAKTLESRICRAISN